MPELPEVETVRRSLRSKLAGERVESVVVAFPGCVERLNESEFSKRLKGKEIKDVDRRGKYLVLRLNGGERLVVHLRMTGRLQFVPKGQVERSDYTRLFIRFSSGNGLRFDDQRKFGRMMWLPDEAALGERLRLGPEPIADDFLARDLQRIVQGRKRPIKSLLLDQRLLAGVGNIYADEALFRAAIAPWRPAGSLSDDDVARLWASLRECLWEGIRYKGSTLRDYVDGDGRPGSFQERLQVYGREGEPCVQCGMEVKRVKIGGRSSFHCEACQA